MKVDDEGLNRLRDIPNVHIDFATGDNDERRSLPMEILREAEFFLCTFPPTNFDEMHDLKMIQVTSSGYQQLVGLNLTERGIRACNGLGEFDIPIAEWVIAMIVNLSRDLRSMIRNQEVGKWDRSPIHQTEIRGRTLGIWGYGGIGRETARIAKAMGLKVHVLTRRGVKPRRNTYRMPGTGDPDGKLPDRVFRLDEKDEFLSGLDFLVLSMPLTEANHGIVAEHELRILPDHAYVLNPARGPLIDEQSLLCALHEKWIAGAALDAHYHYPMPADHPLWQFPNVIITPHISGSGASTHFASRVWDIFVQNVHRFISDQPLLNELTPEQLS
jgi:phosphoglycerate dehydrogenase-like enzyme